MMLGRRVLAEGLGSMTLAATVIGSGIMAERLAGGNAAIALIANTGATVAVLAVLINLLAQVSGAHLNPVVTLVMAIRREMPGRDACLYIPAQVCGCCMGALLAHAMFELPLLQLASRVRSGPAQWLAEVVATAGLIVVILGARRRQDLPWLVASWIGAAYWFTASTSFANPAISIARSITDTFAGIRPFDVPAFIVAQLVGGLTGLLLSRLLFKRPTQRPAGEATPK
jgi:glycerol uptake facilitator-like aquaporin